MSRNKRIRIFDVDQEVITGVFVLSGVKVALHLRYRPGFHITARVVAQIEE